MMKIKHLWLLACLLISFITTTSFAVTSVWWGDANDGLWSNPLNWSEGVPTLSNSAVIAQVPEDDPVIIRDYNGLAQHIMLGQTTNAGESALLIEQTGSLEVKYDIWPGYSAAGTGGTHGIMTLEGGDVLCRMINFTNVSKDLGTNGNQGTVNVYSGTLSCDHIYLPWHNDGKGTLNVAGGLLYVGYSFNISAGAYAGGVGNVKLDGGTIEVDGSFVIGDPNGHVDITKGELIIAGDVTTTINQYVSQGLITAYEGRADVSVELINGDTVVSVDANSPASDLYEDGIVDLLDLAALTNEWLN